MPGFLFNFGKKIPLIKNLFSEYIFKRENKEKFLHTPDIVKGDDIHRSGFMFSEKKMFTMKMHVSSFEPLWG